MCHNRGMNRCRQRWVRLLQGLGVLAGTLLLLIGLLETLFFIGYSAFVPRLLDPLLPQAAAVLMQTSKQATLPKDYVALVGDSYAQGQGDWLIEQVDQAAPDFHSAHLLHRQTGRDVISFGSGGAGSVRGLVTEPVTVLDYLRHSRWPAMEDPQTLLVYFYEGNDLNDNIEYHQKSFDRHFEAEQVWDAAVFRQYLQAFAIESDDLYQQAREEAWRWQPYFLPFVARLLPIVAGQVTMKLSGRAQAPQTRNPYNPPGRFEWFEQGETNRVRINGEVVGIPDSLQGPALDLDDSELQLALYIYEQALRELQRRFPHADLAVLYIPSVLASYELASETVIVQSPMRREKEETADRLRQQHAWLLEQVRQRSETVGVRFADATPALRSASSQAFIHGPKDWNHLNRRGYEALADAARELLESSAQP